MEDISGVRAETRKTLWQSDSRRTVTLILFLQFVVPIISFSSAGLCRLVLLSRHLTPPNEGESHRISYQIYSCLSVFFLAGFKRDA